MTSYQKRFGHNLLRHRKLRRFIVLMHRYATLQIIRQANDAHKKKNQTKNREKKTTMKKANEEELKNKHAKNFSHLR